MSAGDDWSDMTIPGSTKHHPEQAPARRRGLGGELVVLSPVRWTFTWRRPQQIVSRLASGRPTWFVEEPLAVRGLAGPRLRTEEHGDIRRVWLEVPGLEGRVCFTDARAAGYGAQLVALLGPHGGRTAWLYTPMALPLAEALTPDFLVYDVADDVAPARGTTEFGPRQQRLLSRADIVFTGGRSLQRAVARHRPEGTHCFPSGVDPQHYAPAIRMRRRGRRPVAGFVGVIDGRLDLELVADLADALRDWRISLAGPVVDIDAATLPRGRNITYPGPVRYADLPKVLAGVDVALLPFAVSDATCTASPVETLEFLAAGLPVVATRLPDVVADFGRLVDLQDEAGGFAGACRRVLGHPSEARAAKAELSLHWNHWDTIAERMEQLIARAA